MFYSFVLFFCFILFLCFIGPIEGYEATYTCYLDMAKVIIKSENCRYWEEKTCKK